MNKLYGFGLCGLQNGLRVLIEFFAIQSDMVVKVVIDLYASHGPDNNF